VAPTAAGWIWPKAERDATLGPDPVDVVVTVAQVDPEWGPGTPSTVVARL
jgi:hypothetical protein